MARKKEPCTQNSRVCTNCQEEKPLDHFPKLSPGSRGRCGTRGQCLVCYRKKVSERGRKRYRDNALQRREYSRTYYTSNKAEVSTRAAMRKYGVSAEVARKRTQGLCEVCRIPAHEAPKKMLVIDHDHTTGKVRGLLCNHCNTALGLLRESREVVQNLIQYIDKHKEC